MKEGIFSFLSAALFAWLTVVLLVWINTHWLGLSDFFSGIVGLIHSHGWEVRRVAFWIIFVLYWATGFHKLEGNWLFWMIGFAIFIVLAIIIVYFGWKFLGWLSGTL